MEHRSQQWTDDAMRSCSFAPTELCGQTAEFMGLIDADDPEPVVSTEERPIKRRATFAVSVATLLLQFVPTGVARAEPAGDYSYNLPLSLAVEAAEEAIRVCEGNGYKVTATVVDMSGTPKVVLRGDHSTVHTGESSFRKAFTVVTLGPMFHFETSGAFFDLTKTNPYAPELATIHNVLALPGAVAFTSRGEMVGALGVGGAPGGDKDEVCAQAGIAKVKDRLPQ